MGLIPNSKDLEKAGEQLGQNLEEQAVQLITSVVLPKLKETVIETLDGLSITVTIAVTRKNKNDLSDPV